MVGTFRATGMLDSSMAKVANPLANRAREVVVVVVAVVVVVVAVVAVVVVVAMGATSPGGLPTPSHMTFVLGVGVRGIGHVSAPPQ